MKYTDDEIKYLEKYYADYDSQSIADNLGRPISSIYNLAYKLGLKKSVSWWQADLDIRRKLLAENGKKHRFTKGHVPANKGKKMPGEVYEKVKHTMFKKGSEPAGTKIDMDISVRFESQSERAYLYIRLSKRKWIPYHTYYWETKYGKIPPGHCLWFIDGNSLNVTIKNLECITRAENAIRNKHKIHLLPKDLQKTMRLKFLLSKTIKEKNKNGRKK